ncbi:short-chain dehydrogenase [Apiospora saccharicola]|uniref:Short-chain dehydrogenase n=1 Tax=Apiospora saccharicola TaxID=335842 RepID=A0ABR1V1H3_9PEZI
MGFLYSQLFKKLPLPTISYTGKTVVITGSNTGLGKEAARHFINLGVTRLILAVRSIDKGNAAKEDIERTTKCRKDLMQVWKLDMGSYASVKQFAARINNELDRLDIFIANAGVAPPHFTMLEDNEASITVNVVSTFLLAALIMPKLKATAAAFPGTRPTLSLTSSGVHGFTKFPHKTAPEGQIFATLNDKAFAEKHWLDQYQVSKLLEVYGVRAIAQQHPAATYPVTINCVDPGLCKTDLQKETPLSPLILVVNAASAMLGRSPEVGSKTLVHGGSSGAETHGQYLSDCAVASPAPTVTSPEGNVLQRRVWAELVQKLEAIQPGVVGNF